jgi:hypothetical protein
MGKEVWFRPDEPINRRYGGMALILACFCAASLSAAFGVLSYQDLVSLPRWAPVTIREALIAIPIFLVVRNPPRSLDTYWSVMACAVAIVAADSVIFAQEAIGDLLTAVGATGSPLQGGLWFWPVTLLPIAIVLCLSVKAFFAFAVSGTWAIRAATTERRERWRIVLLDKGIGLAVAWVIGCAAILALPFGMSHPLGVISLLFLLTPWVLGYLEGRGKPIAPPVDIGQVEQQRWLCEQVGAPYAASSPNEDEVVYGSRGVWWGDPLIIAHVREQGDSQWVACCGRTWTEKKLWSVRIPDFYELRPDIAPLMGLPSGWVITTDPPAVRYAPDIAARVEVAVAACKVVASRPQGLEQEPQG